MRMQMCQRFVAVAMAVLSAGRNGLVMVVPVVLVVDMLVLVLQRLVGMFVRVMLR
jgi:hypothetical protein